MNVNTYDIVILGAGPAGLSAAITLGQHTDLKILVADAGLPGIHRPGESIPPTALSCIAALGLSEIFSDGSHFSYPGHASVWGRNEPGYNDALLDPMGPPYRLNRLQFDQMLVDSLTSYPSVHLEWGYNYIKHQFNTSTSAYEMLFTNQKTQKQEQVITRFVIDASGARARFSRTEGAIRRIDDQMVALIGMQKITEGHITAQTLIEAEENGWWYMAKLPENQLITLFVTEPQLLKQTGYNDVLNRKPALDRTHLIAKHLSCIQLQEGQWYHAPVHSSYLEKPYGSRWLATGDAAVCYDPIAAQGIHKALSLGIRSGKIAAQLFETDFQNKEVLQQYAQYCKATYSTYFTQRTQLYSNEKRWLNAPFWQNRLKVYNTVLKVV
ncbi:FAD-dependent monooxygenase [Flavobacterium cerinum]|uniref:Tryptophan 7-halogenase n=1 Tax=Flavobacterium cerinum TaxID=2502784 RepID=A0ABY5INX3_9FLAO|nr:FAD-dependent monooxygenase [Flavobacterium cerinum]UUC43925.1 tryptophan 7-halogenase [Flavobacterium cerinum]